MNSRTAKKTFLVLSFLLLCCKVAYADLVTFGSGSNQFTMNFVEIGNPGNPSDSTGNPSQAGGVAYQYRIGKFEVSRDMVNKANAEGSLGITLEDMTPYGGNGLNRPATGISFVEAALFANWLNTSQGYQAAYRFDKDGNPITWSSSDAWQAGGENLYRHKDSRYWVTSMNEWYKAAYYNPSTGTYFDYPTSDGSIPIPVAGGTDDKTAVIYMGLSTGPADITNAGGLSASGVMGMAGNAWEWEEISSYNQSNVRGGAWWDIRNFASSSERQSNSVWSARRDMGFRIAGLSSVPEPNSFFVTTLLAVAMAFKRRNR